MSNNYGMNYSADIHQNISILAFTELPAISQTSLLKVTCALWFQVCSNLKPEAKKTINGKQIIMIEQKAPCHFLQRVRPFGLHL